MLGSNIEIAKLNRRKTLLKLIKKRRNIRINSIKMNCKNKNQINKNKNLNKKQNKNLSYKNKNQIKYN